MCCAEVVGREPAIELSAVSPGVHLALDADPRAVRLARTFVRDAVDIADEELVDDLVLLTSELVTNAVVHARTPIEVGVVRGDDHVLVSVGDHNPARPEQQPFDTDRAGGRGLLIVRRLTNSWGITAHEKGKSVWFTLRAGGAGDGTRHG